MFDIYLDKMVYLSPDTAKAYSKMISEFIMYSPGIDPNYLNRFISNKFKIPKRSGIFKYHLNGTSLKYYRWIDGFLRLIYDSGYSLLNPEFSDSLNKNFKSQEKFPTMLEFN